MATQRIRSSAALLLGLFLGAAGHAFISPPGNQVAAAKDAPSAPDLKAEMEAIKTKLPDQART
jgi:hypothetical protein